VLASDSVRVQAQASVSLWAVAVLVRGELALGLESEVLPAAAQAPPSSRARLGASLPPVQQSAPAFQPLAPVLQVAHPESQAASLRGEKAVRVPALALALAWPQAVAREWPQGQLPAPTSAVGAVLASLLLRQGSSPQVPVTPSLQEGAAERVPVVLREVPS
jgi:hypothetical protein